MASDIITGMPARARRRSRGADPRPRRRSRCRSSATAPRGIRLAGGATSTPTSGRLRGIRSCRAASRLQPRAGLRCALRTPSARLARGAGLHDDQIVSVILRHVAYVRPVECFQRGQQVRRGGYQASVRLLLSVARRAPDHARANLDVSDIMRRIWIAVGVDQSLDGPRPRSVPAAPASRISRVQVRAVALM